MAASYFSIDKKHRSLIANLGDKGILGFKDASTWQIFCFALAMGINQPTEIKTKDSYARTEYLKTDLRSKAIIEAVSIARSENNGDVDSYSTMEKVENYTEELANAGFELLQEKYDEVIRAGEGKELFERRMLGELESLYLKNIYDL